MTAQIDLSRAPGPVPGPFASALQAIAMGAFVGFMMLFPIGLLFWPIAALFPALAPAAIAAGLGLSEDAFVWKIVFPGAATVFIACFLAGAVVTHAWRTPVYGVRMGVLCARLRRFRRNLPASLRRGRIWGVLNLLAAPVLLFAPVIMNRIFGAPLAHVPESWRGVAVPLLLILILGGALSLIVNGARLFVGRSSAVRYFTSLVLRAAPFLAFVLFLLAGMAVGVAASGAGRLNGANLVISLIAGAAIGFVAMRWLSARLLDRAHAMALPHAKDALWSDRRRPVLFLRSFKDDSSLTSAGGADAPTDPEQIERLEDVLAGVATSYGPLIAVGEPGVLPRSGAARAYYAGDDWREAVKTWMDQALFILMIAGFTEGVRWELDTAIERGHADKLVLIFPPNDRNFEARWAWVQDRFAKAAVAAQMREADRAGAIAMHLDARGQLAVLRSRDPTTAHYKTALALSLYGMFRREDGELAWRPSVG